MLSLGRFLHILDFIAVWLVLPYHPPHNAFLILHYLILIGTCDSLFRIMVAGNVYVYV